MAIRMRRGLSVVRGGIGTGKTTISRKLIQNFSSDDDVKFEFYPVLDPKFESELVLLQHLVDLFGIEEDAGKSMHDVYKDKSVIDLNRAGFMYLCLCLGSFRRTWWHEPLYVAIRRCGRY